VKKGVSKSALREIIVWDLLSEMKRSYVKPKSVVQRYRDFS
jgi:hypothetical protein